MDHAWKAAATSISVFHSLHIIFVTYIEQVQGRLRNAKNFRSRNLQHFIVFANHLLVRSIDICIMSIGIAELDQAVSSGRIADIAGILDRHELEVRTTIIDWWSNDALFKTLRDAC